MVFFHSIRLFNFLEFSQNEVDSPTISPQPGGPGTLILIYSSPRRLPLSLSVQPLAYYKLFRIHSRWSPSYYPRTQVTLRLPSRTPFFLLACDPSAAWIGITTIHIKLMYKYLYKMRIKVYNIYSMTV